MPGVYMHTTPPPCSGVSYRKTNDCIQMVLVCITSSVQYNQPGPILSPYYTVPHRSPSLNTKFWLEGQQQCLHPTSVAIPQSYYPFAISCALICIAYDIMATESHFSISVESTYR